MLAESVLGAVIGLVIVLSLLPTPGLGQSQSETAVAKACGEWEKTKGRTKKGRKKGNKGAKVGWEKGEKESRKGWDKTKNEAGGVDKGWNKEREKTKVGKKESGNRAAAFLAVREDHLFKRRMPLVHIVTASLC